MHAQSDLKLTCPRMSEGSVSHFVGHFVAEYPLLRGADNDKESGDMAILQCRQLSEQGLYVGSLSVRQP